VAGARAGRAFFRTLHSQEPGAPLLVSMAPKAHIETNAEALVPIGQQMLDRGERRRLDQVDHNRRGEHGDAPRTDSRRRVF
jgi:hypothetical protein